MKLTNLVVALMATTVLFAGCGGGADSTESGKKSVMATTFTAAEQKAAAEELDNPPLTGKPATSDLKRMREGRMEMWREGDATTPPVIPEDKKGKEHRRKKGKTEVGEGRKVTLAAGDPVQKVMGETVEVAPPPTNIPADASTRGMWSGVFNWPLIPIHMAMLPDGRLMSFGTTEGGRQTGKTIYAIFDPADGLIDGHTIYPKQTLADIFCSAQLFLPLTNQMLTVGGDNLQADGFTNNTGNNASTLYDPTTNTMVAGKNMFLPRWYASVTTLGDGTSFIQGGLGGEAYPEVRLANGNYRALTAANTSNLDYWYPRNWLHSSGRIFGYDSYGNYYFINPAGTGTLQIVNQWDVDAFGEAGSAVKYEPGKVLQLAAYTNRVSIINMTTNTPTITATAPLNARRQNVSATVLPNGHVLATGGSTVYNDAASANNTAMIWNPATGTWTLGSDGYLARLYHSMAMLMPDGTVLVGGGGAWGPLSNNNVEFYYPPYLFKPDGTLATKPQVTAAPTTMELNGTFQLTVSDATAPITRVTMIKSGSVTHSVNFDQNFNNLTFTRAGNVLTVKVPTNSYDATPGYYMVFALTASGTPSQARLIRLNVPSVAIPAPTAVTATYAVASGVTVKWTQSTGVGVTHNIISRGTSASGPFTQLAKIPAAKQYIDPNQTVGTYYYVVTAVNTNQAISTNSNVVTVTIGTPVDVIPGAPTGLTSAFTAGAGVRLNWTNPTGTVTSVEVQRRLGTGAWATVATLGNVATYLDPIAVDGTYGYQVRAVNSAGPGQYSNISSATVTSTAPPGTLAAPTGLSGYTCGAGCWSTDTGVRFNWTPTAGVTNHVVERSVGAVGNWQAVATLGATTGLYVDKQVTSGTTYFYRVMATTATNTSPYATLSYGITSNITLGGPPAAPDANPTGPGSVTAGQVAALSGSTSTSGSTIVGYEWAITNAGGTGATFTGPINTVTASVATTTAGTFTASLKITDSAGLTNTDVVSVTVLPAGTGTAFGITSQEQTKYLVMNWWRGDPAVEGNFRKPGICTGPAPTGNCYLGARKTFRPMAFNIATTPAAVAGLVMMDVPQFENGVKSYDHYRLPVELVKTACTFKVRHVRTHGPLEFGLNPPGLEILDHEFRLTQALCDAYPTGAMTQAWLNSLNTALTTYLGPKVAYNPIAYPYNDPRTHTDPTN